MKNENHSLSQQSAFAAGQALERRLSGRGITNKTTQRQVAVRRSTRRFPDGSSEVIEELVIHEIEEWNV